MDMQFSTDTKKWLAVQSKDKKADGLFVYAVRTTKIFCRPVCKARLARRSNVAFYESAHEAERAGYRACKRCKPTTSGAMPEEDAVNKIKSWVSQESLRNQQPSCQGIDTTDSRPETLTVADIARQAGVSKWHFHRLFKEISGRTPAEFLDQQKGQSRAAFDSSSSSSDCISSLATETGLDMLEFSADLFNLQPGEADEIMDDKWINEILSNMATASDGNLTDLHHLDPPYFFPDSNDADQSHLSGDFLVAEPVLLPNWGPSEEEALHQNVAAWRRDT